jgi:ABC-type antimicrobial peptide transport system permease subunit
LGAVVAALLIGSLSGYLASRRAAKLLPAEALRQL